MVPSGVARESCANGLVSFDASCRFGTGCIGDEDLRAAVARWLVGLLDDAIGAEIRRVVPPDALCRLSCGRGIVAIGSRYGRRASGGVPGGEGGSHTWIIRPPHALDATLSPRRSRATISSAAERLALRPDDGPNGTLTASKPPGFHTSAASSPSIDERM